MNPIYLPIEFLDELVFGVPAASWPLLRADLHLHYLQIGLALSLPGILGNLIEPIVGVLGVVWKRRVLIVGGGIFFAFACLLTALSHSFLFLLVAFLLFYPASGAFVSLTQASPMDSNPSRHEQNMALDVCLLPRRVLGPPPLERCCPAGAWLAVLAGLSVSGAWRVLQPLPKQARTSAPWDQLRLGFRSALAALTRPAVLRWLILLEFSDLILDGLFSYLALYFVDVAGFTVPHMPRWRSCSGPGSGCLATFC
jgi:FSR family fosmidomycin resistance protein-like MFS transporter